MNFNFIISGLLLLLSAPYLYCQNGLCSPHCECDGDTVTCTYISAIPSIMSNSTEYLTLSNNFIGPILLRFEVDRLKYIPLRQLYLKNNRIENIEGGALSSLPQLEVLDISGNNIRSFTPNAFAGLENLKYLFANDAGIDHINVQAFAHTPMIIEIDLENNRLKSVATEFSSLRNMKELLLARNKISEIKGDAFSTLHSLKHLSLFGNQLNQPISAWFERVIGNNGIVELDFRHNSSLRIPNPWLCCPKMAQYPEYIKGLSKNLLSYPQLDVSCSWPVAVSGRIASSLSQEEINAVPCAAYSTSTVYTTSTTDPWANKDDVAIKVEVTRGNFLTNLNDAGVFFLLIFFLVIGCFIGLFVYWCKARNGGKKLHDFADSFRNKGSNEKREPQKDPEGQGNIVTNTFYSRGGNRAPPSKTARPARPSRPAPSAPVASPRRGNPHASVVPEKEHATYTIETDYSEEEIWNKNT